MSVEGAAACYGLPQGVRYRAMFAVVLAVFISVLDYAVTNVALPTIAEELHVTSSQSIWAINVYQLAALALLFPVSALGSRVGYARMCYIGITLFLVASTLAAFTSSLLTLSLARALQGAGSACIMGVNLALIRFIYPQRTIGKGIALNSFALGLGVACGPSIGSAVLTLASWRWIYLINLPLDLIALTLALTSLPKTPLSEQKLDLKAIALSVLALTLTVIGLDALVHGGGISAMGLITLGLVCGVMLVRREKFSQFRIVPTDILPIPRIFVAFTCGTLVYISSNLFVIALPFTLEAVFNRSPSEVGLLITPWALSISIMSFVIGRWTDRLPAAQICASGLFLMGSAFLLLWLLPETAPNFSIAWRVAIGGGGFGLFHPPNNRVLMVATPQGREGGASGLASVERLGGQTLGALCVAAIFRLSGHETKICLLAASVIAFAGSIFSLGREYLISLGERTRSA